jgi:hypothetical protein
MLIVHDLELLVSRDRVRRACSVTRGSFGQQVCCRVRSTFPFSPRFLSNIHHAQMMVF